MPDRLSLKALPFEPSVYKPIEYTPVSMDLSINERALARQEAIREKALDAVKENALSLSKIEGALRPELKPWFDEYKANIVNNINSLVDNGDWYNLSNDIRDYAAKMALDRELSSRIEASAQYNAKLAEVHEMSTKGLISPDTEQWFISNNPFTYESAYDRDGNIIGGTQYTTMQLPYKDIDISKFAERAYALINPDTLPSVTNYKNNVTKVTTRQVTTNEIIANLDYLFAAIPDAEGALRQRFETELYRLDKVGEKYGKNSREYIQLESLICTNGSPSFENYVAKVVYGEMSKNNNILTNLANKQTQYDIASKGSSKDKDGNTVTDNIPAYTPVPSNPSVTSTTSRITNGGPAKAKEEMHKINGN